MKIAIVYDKGLRPDTTGPHCKEALEFLGHKVTHFSPEASLTIKPEFDFYLQIDDDLPYFWDAPNLTPNAYWMIDTHRLCSGDHFRVKKAKMFQNVFTAHKDGVELMECENIKAKWVGLGFNKRVHRIIPDTLKKYDWCFIGQQAHPKRKWYLPKLAKEYPNCFVGSAFGEEYVKIYNESKIIFNASLSNSVNMRIFEAMACGGMLLTDDVANGLQEEVTPIQTYKNEAELFRKMKFWLKYAGARERQCEKNHESVQNFSYDERMKTILNEVFGNES